MSLKACHLYPNPIGQIKPYGQARYEWGRKVHKPYGGGGGGMNYSQARIRFATVFKSGTESAATNTSTRNAGDWRASLYF